jgi:hypothetical protein
MRGLLSLSIVVAAVRLGAVDAGRYLECLAGYDQAVLLSIGGCTDQAGVALRRLLVAG